MLSRVLIQSAHFGDHVRIAHRMNPDAFDYNKGLMPINENDSHDIPKSPTLCTPLSAAVGRVWTHIEQAW
jgi:hypothetical protein